MPIVEALINMIGNIIVGTIKVGIISVVTIVTGGAVLAGLTKPSEKSFADYVRSLAQQNSTKSGLIESVKVAIVAKAANYMLNPKFVDYGLVRIAVVGTNENPKYFLGTLNTWFPIN